MRRSGVAAVVVAAALLTVAAGAAAAPEPESPTGTSPAFADSVGIGSSSWFDEVMYGDYDLVHQLLDDLGVKHLRGGIRIDGDPGDYDAFRELAADGYRYLWIAGRPEEPGDAQNAFDVRNMLSDPTRLGGTTEAIEGPNEYDNRADEDPAWAGRLYVHMATAYPLMKNDSALGAFPFYGPSFLGDAGRTTYAALPGSGDLMDRANVHYYAGRELPEDMANDLEFQSSVFDDVWAGGIKLHEVRNRNPVVTETGFSTMVGAGNWWHYGISERAQSILLLRTLLTAFASRVPRTYIHHLLDPWPDPDRSNLENGFGLVRVTGEPPPAGNRHEWTATPKPAYNSLRELLETMRGSGSGGEGSNLSYEVTDGPSTLKQVLLARGDGSYDLVLWNAVPVYNQRTADCNDPRIPSTVLPQDRCHYAQVHFSVDHGEAFPSDVTVTLDLAERAGVSTERPHSETSFTSRGAGKTFSLAVGADPVIVRIVPSYALAIRSDSPRAWLRLGETSGSPIDSAGQNATTQAWTASPTRGLPSAVGDSTDTSVSVAPGQRTTVRLDSPVSTGTGASIELWAKPDAAVPDFVEFLTADTADPWRVKMRTYNVNNGYWGSVYGSSPGSTGEMIFKGFDHGQWHHLVLTMANGASTTYLDGKKVGETAGGDALDVRSFTIGGANGTGFRGGLDELAVYGKALSASSVCAHYRAAGGSC